MKTKKLCNRLTLNKATISNLSDLDLYNVKGGATWKCASYPEVCDTYTDCDLTDWILCTDSACPTYTC